MGHLAILSSRKINSPVEGSRADTQLRLLDAVADFAQALEAGAVGGDDAFEAEPWFRFLQNLIRVEKIVFLGDTVFVPTRHFFAGVFERQGQAQLRADAISVRADMPDDAKRAVFP